MHCIHVRTSVILRVVVVVVVVVARRPTCRRLVTTMLWLLLVVMVMMMKTIKFQSDVVKLERWSLTNKRRWCARCWRHSLHPAHCTTSTTPAIFTTHPSLIHKDVPRSTVLSEVLKAYSDKYTYRVVQKADTHTVSRVSAFLDHPVQLWVHAVFFLTFFCNIAIALCLL